MSDVYAMGGEVVLALNICAFPPTLPMDIVSEILRGGAEKVAEAGGVLGGGHSIDDKEPKYGLSVVGHIHPRKVLKKSGAKPGDLLVLTKPLGVGIVTTAAKNDMALDTHLNAAIESMLRLNRAAARAAEKIGVNECTDITGFALLGHAAQVAANSEVRLKLRFGSLPYVEGSKKYANDWLFPGGTNKNQAFFERNITFEDSISREMRMLMFTPETSGGLLLSVSRFRHDELIKALEQDGLGAWTIGEVLEGCGVEVVE
jgi:selenide,water dikinase